MYRAGSRSWPDTRFAGSLIWNFTPPELREINICCLGHPVYANFCYISPNEVRWEALSYVANISLGSADCLNGRPQSGPILSMKEGGGQKWKTQEGAGDDCVNGRCRRNESRPRITKSIWDCSFQTDKVGFDNAILFSDQAQIKHSHHQGTDYLERHMLGSSPFYISSG